MIGRAELSRLANESGVGEIVQEKDYVLAWLLRAVGAADDPRVVFKGGTCLRHCYLDQYRYSEDLDFTVAGEWTARQMAAAVTGWCAFVAGEAGIQAQARPDDDAPDLKSWVTYTGPLGSIRQDGIKVDVSSDEAVLLGVATPTLWRGYTDLPDDQAGIGAYSLPEIWAEKTRSLMQRSQPRDVYDLVSLVRHDGRLAAEAHGAFLDKAVAKGIDPSRFGHVFDAREAGMRQRWTQSMSHQVRDLPHFNEEWRILKRAYRQAGYLG